MVITKRKIPLGTLPIDHAIEFRDEVSNLHWGKGIYIELRGRGGRPPKIGGHNEVTLDKAQRAKLYLTMVWNGKERRK